MIKTVSKAVSIASCWINVATRSYVAAANEFVRIGYEITSARGVPDGELVHDLPRVEAGLRAWLATHVLKYVRIEFLDARGKCVEMYEFPVTYENAGTDGEHFDTDIDGLRAELSKLPPIKATSYRFIVQTGKSAIKVPGWQSCTLSDTSHLKKRSLLSRLFSSAAVNVASFIYTGE